MCLCVTLFVDVTSIVVVSKMVDRLDVAVVGWLIVELMLSSPALLKFVPIVLTVTCLEVFIDGAIFELNNISRLVCKEVFFKLLSPCLVFAAVTSDRQTVSIKNTVSMTFRTCGERD